MQRSLSPRTSRYYHNSFRPPWFPENQQYSPHIYGQIYPYFQNPYVQGENIHPSYYQQQYYNPYPQQANMQPYNNSMLNTPFSNPYPTNAFKQQNSGFQTVLAQFKKEDGTYDVNKMMNTAGQMMGTVNQVSGMVKGLSSIFKA
jgi:hypothetical protein